MTRKIIITCYLIAFTTIVMQAQNYKGIVCDSATKAPIEDVIIFSAYENKATNRTNSGTDGSFSIEVKEQPSFLVFNMTGYKKKIIALKKKVTDLGTIYLSPVVLKEVSVTASSNVSTIDKDIYYITDKNREGNMNAGEMLGTLPNISYNWYNKKIKVNGQDNVKLIVDGIEKPEYYIKEINPKRIKAVEVIHNPGGRYLSENLDAIINIILYEDYVGYDITAENSTNIRLNKLFKRESLFKESPNVTATYTKNKMTIYTGYSSSFNHILMSNYDYKNYPGYMESGTMDSNDDNLKINKKNHKITTGIDYQLSKNHSLSAQISYALNDNKMDITNDIWYEKNGIKEDNKYQNINKNDNTGDVIGAVFYNGKIGEKLKIYSELNYNYYNQDTKTDVIQQNLFSYNANVNSYKNYIHYNVDGTYTTGNSTIKAGYSTTWKNYISKIVLNNKINEETDNYRNRVFAYYTNKLSSEMSFSVGTAGEWLKYNTSLGTEMHFTLFPDAKLFYKPSRNLDMNLQYYSGVDYPTLSQTMVSYRSDSLLMITANPNLRQMTTHNITARVRLFNTVNLMPKVSLCKDKHFSYYEGLGYGQVSKTNINADWKSYSMGVSFDKMIGNFYLSAQLAYEYNKISYNNETNDNHNITGGMTFMYMDRKSKLRMFMQFDKQNRKSITPQEYIINGDNILLLALNKSFFKDKASVMLAYLPPLTFIEGKNKKVINTPYYENSSYDNSAKLTQNMLMLRINIRLSNGKRTNKKTHSANVDKESIPE